MAYACDRGQRCAIVLLELSTGRTDWIAGQYNDWDDTYWHLQFTPDGESLACVLAEDDEALHELILIDISTRRQRRLTENAQVSSHDLSPDGTNVLYTGGHEGRHGLYRIDLISEQVTRVINDGSKTRYRSPLHSPDGTRIAVEASVGDRHVGDDGEEAPYQLFVMNADGSYARQVTDFPGGICGKVWHPDGEQIAFTIHAELDAGVERLLWDYRRNIYIVNTDGTGLRQLEHSNSFNSLISFRPGDGRYLSYSSSCESRFPEGLRNWDGRLIDIVTGEIIYVTDNDAYDGAPIFSPDGKTLLFMSDRQSEPRSRGMSLYTVEMTD